MSRQEFSATYGQFNLDMLPVQVIDVKNEVVSRFLQGDKIVIPVGTDFNSCFTDPTYGARKFLQIETAKRTYNIIEDNYTQDIVLNLSADQKRIKLIYYVYVSQNSNWRGIISGQVLQMKSYGILNEADFYVHVTDTGGIINQVVDFIKTLFSEAIISTSSENYFEYPGIRLVYDLAKMDPDCIFLYMHSKGMSYNIHSRRVEEIALLTKTFEDWRKKIELFADDKINKIGLFPAIGDNKDVEQVGVRGGWIWFNFWYARGSYIVRCNEPIVTDDRYFFEHWLGLQNGTLVINDDCYNLFQKREQKYFSPLQAVEGLDELVKQVNQY